MLNQTIIVGRIFKIIKNNDETVTLVISIQRNYKNNNNDYDIDYIDCILNERLISKSINLMKINDLIGVKGHIESTCLAKKKTIVIVVEKITLLSNRKEQ